MSAAASAVLEEKDHRPRLVVIHCRQPESADSGSPDSALYARSDGPRQQELPLPWPLDRNGEAAAAGLASYPALPLRPGVARPEPFVANLARLVADVLVGARPASQLSRHAVLDVCQRLTRRSCVRRSQGLVSSVPARVTSTSTMVVGPTAVQSVVVFFDGRRAHGAALRLEYRHNRWMLTEVQSPA